MEAAVRQYLRYQQDLGGDEVVLTEPYQPQPASLPMHPTGRRTRTGGIAGLKTSGADLETSFDLNFLDDKAPGRRPEASQQPRPAPRRAPPLQTLEELLDHHRGLPAYGKNPILPPAGPARAELAILTLLPTARDDGEGRLFSGEDGDLLYKMLRAIGLHGDRVYKTCLVKNAETFHRMSWRDRTYCLQLLHRELSWVETPCLLLLGGKCAQFFLKTGQPLSRLRQQVFQQTLNDRPAPLKAAATYHPQELLLKPDLKREAWGDLQWLQKTFALSGLDPQA